MMRYVIRVEGSGVRFVRETVGDTLILVARLIRDESAAVWVEDTAAGHRYHCSDLSGLLEGKPCLEAQKARSDPPM
jgi:hypothetical protein